MTFNAPLLEISYELVDTKTNAIIGRYNYAQRNRGRAKADTLDLKYGAVRYIMRMVQSRPKMGA